MLDPIYRDFAVEQAVKLLSIDSPSGYTEQAAQWVLEAFRSLGCEAHITTKGGILACLGGKDADHALMLGVPAKIRGWACQCGALLHFDGEMATCTACGRSYRMKAENEVEECK